MKNSIASGVNLGAMQFVEFEGWRCAQISHGPLTVWITLDFGPRIIGLTYNESPNLFYIKPSTKGKVGLSEYTGYGGHRLWTAPEVPARTYEPDNDPVTILDDWFCTAESPLGLNRALRVVPRGDNQLAIQHRITNSSEESITIAPWAITVMRAGGECHFSHNSEGQGGNPKLPSTPIVLWPYADMTDTRWEWRKNCTVLKQSDDPNPQKCGSFVQPGIAHYWIDGLLFTKSFGSDGGEYPDFGCNFEMYTRHDMLEVESVGPLQVLNPGESALHEEVWSVKECTRQELEILRSERT
ncbi:MAG: hypothetical protein J0L72_09925 [Armatimonadetes bacterium]|nr:hypothetical protein [Armatimonadota bacterium]